MPIDATIPGSPGWWLARLAQAQHERRERLDALWKRYQGDPPLPELVSEQAQTRRAQVWRAFQRKARTNYAELIVESVRERMTPVGFRTPVVAGDDGDDVARRIWSANEMPVESADILEMMLVLGDAYTIVGPPAPDSGIPVITGEDPRQVITEHDPVRQSRVLAALKTYYDPAAQADLAYLYLPGVVHVARRPGTHSALGGAFRLSMSAWDWDEAATVRLPPAVADAVPVVRFHNRRGVGEFELHTDHLDRINYMLLQRMVIATLQAFRQRAVKGIPDKDPKTGERIDYTDVFTNDPDALWLLPATAELWESGQVDLTPLLSSVRDDVRDLAAVTRIPVGYFQADAVNQSAEGASTQREGLVYRTEDRMVRAGAGFAQTMTTAFRMLGEADRAKAVETLWKPAERFGLAERYAANLAATQGGVPWRTRMTEILQFSPDAVTRMDAERAEDLLFAPPSTPAPVAPGGPSRGL